MSSSFHANANRACLTPLATATCATAAVYKTCFGRKPLCIKRFLQLAGTPVEEAKAMKREGAQPADSVRLAS